jgi:membrane associated rhomboid family serine protease
MLFPLYDENPTKSVPWMTILLIVANVLVFLYELSLQSSGQLQQFFQTAALVPYEITHLSKLTPGVTNIGVLAFFTSMFMHAGWLHILGNMWYLWIFGNNIEETLGSVRYIFFYLLCGLGGGIGHILSQPNSQIPTLGASGAIAGVLAGYLVLFPTARIVTIIPIFIFLQVIRVPAIILIGLWFLIQILSGAGSLTSQAAAGTAWFAHVGGFITGIVLILLLARRTPQGPED